MNHRDTHRALWILVTHGIVTWRERVPNCKT